MKWFKIYWVQCTQISVLKMQADFICVSLYVWNVRCAYVKMWYMAKKFTESWVENADCTYATSQIQNGSG